MLHEIMTEKCKGKVLVQLKIDSKTLYDSLKSTKQIEEKTIQHLIAWQKQQIEDKSIEKIDQVCSEEMVADVFTKKDVKTDQVLKIVTGGKLNI